jgi:hypothetical protein
MWQALASLPRKQRTVLVLRFYEDCTDSTIATILGCAVSTVRSDTARAPSAELEPHIPGKQTQLTGHRHGISAAVGSFAGLSNRFRAASPGTVEVAVTHAACAEIPEPAPDCRGGIVSDGLVEILVLALP